MTLSIHLEIPEPEHALDAMDLLKARLLYAKKLMHKLHDVRSQELELLHALERRSGDVRERLERAQELLTRP